MRARVCVQEVGKENSTTNKYYKKSGRTPKRNAFAGATTIIYVHGRRRVVCVCVENLRSVD